MPPDPLLDKWRDQQVVRDGSDLLGIAPCPLEFRELTREGTSFELLVCRHFQGEATLGGQAFQRDADPESLRLSDSGETDVFIGSTEKLDRVRNFPR